MVFIFWRFYAVNSPNVQNYIGPRQESHVFAIFEHFNVATGDEKKKCMYLFYARISFLSELFPSRTAVRRPPPDSGGNLLSV